MRLFYVMFFSAIKEISKSLKIKASISKPMEISEKAVDVINDLIKINNDRVAGFEKAGDDLEEDNKYVVAIFNKLAGESQQYVVELTGIAQEYGEAADGTSTSGDLHRAWIDIKTTFTGSDLLAILNGPKVPQDAAAV